MLYVIGRLGKGKLKVYDTDDGVIERVSPSLLAEYLSRGGTVRNVRLGRAVKNGDLAYTVDIKGSNDFSFVIDSKYFISSAYYSNKVIMDGLGVCLSGATVLFYYRGTLVSVSDVNASDCSFYFTSEYFVIESRTGKLRLYGLNGTIDKIDSDGDIKYKLSNCNNATFKRIALCS